MLDTKAYKRGRISSRQFKGNREKASQVGVYNPFLPGTLRAESWDLGWKSGKEPGAIAFAFPNKGV